MKYVIFASFILSLGLAGIVLSQSFREFVFDKKTLSVIGLIISAFIVMFYTAITFSGATLKVF